LKSSIADFVLQKLNGANLFFIEKQSKQNLFYIPYTLKQILAFLSHRKHLPRTHADTLNLLRCTRFNARAQKGTHTASANF